MRSMARLMRGCCLSLYDFTNKDRLYFPRRSPWTDSFLHLGHLFCNHVEKEMPIVKHTHVDHISSFSALFSCIWFFKFVLLGGYWWHRPLFRVRVHTNSDCHPFKTVDSADVKGRGCSFPAPRERIRLSVVCVCGCVCVCVCVCVW